MEKSRCKVCVTGGTGYVASSLIKKLLEKGYTVHATLRNLEDRSKVDLLNSFPEAETRLVLFEADIYDSNKFKDPIQGCEFVLHVATPMSHIENSQFKNMTEASVAAAKSIATFCIQSGTVRRLLYTGALSSASPIKEDGTSFKDLIDETCWTPLTLSFSDENLREYMESKMQTEKQILSYGSNSHGSGLEVASLDLGLVTGDTVLPYTPSSIILCLSQLVNNEFMYRNLRNGEELLGKIPVVHIDDVCEAHIFCMEKPSINGRFFCAGGFVSSAEIAHYYQQNYPEFHVKREYLDVPKRDIKWGATKLTEKGFQYKYDTNMILDASVKCARRTGYLFHSNLSCFVRDFLCP